MHSAENYPAVSRLAFHDRGRAVRILPYDLAPSAKLGAIFPILIKLRTVGSGDLNRLFVNALEFVGVIVKPNILREP